MRHLVAIAVLLCQAVAGAAAPVPPSRIDVDEEFALDTFDSDARLSVTLTFSGAPAVAFERTVASGDAAALRHSATALYAGTYPGIVTAGVPTLTKGDGSIALRARYIVPKPLVARGEYQELRLDGRMMEWARQALTRWLQDGDAVAYAGTQRVRVVWPAHVRANDVPGASSMENAWFDYRREHLQRGNVLELQATFALKPGTGAAAGLQEQVRLLGERQIAAVGVGPAAMLPPTLRAVPFPTAEAYLAAQELKARTAALPPGPVPPSAGCPVLHMALLAGDLAPGALRERLAALTSELAADPARDGVRRCVGETRYAAGDFAGTVRLLEAAAPFPAAHSMNRLYAWALAMAGERTRAVEMMRRYHDARVAAGSDSVYDLIRYAALLRYATGELPPPLRARLAARTGAFWPEPIARMQAGMLDLEALRAHAAAIPGDSGALAVGEAEFYLGVERSASGDREGARRAFRSALANGARSTFEYLLAAGALRALGDTSERSMAAASAESLYRGVDNLDPESLTVLGKRVAVTGDARGVKYLRQAAALGNRGAQAALGTVLLDTVPEEAAIWNGALAERGDVQAQLRIVQQLQRGAGVAKDGERALALLRPIAERGVPDAEVMLAMMYHIDRGEPANAVEWYRKAAAHGKSEALTNLADMYENGTGIAPDLAQAVALYRQAARLQDNVAFASLGSLYEQGKGVSADATLACTYYLLAERFGWRGNEATALTRRLMERQAAAAKEAAARWSKEMPLPGM